MLVVNTTWRLWVAGMAVSLAIFGVVFLTVIKPEQRHRQPGDQVGAAAEPAGDRPGEEAVRDGHQPGRPGGRAGGSRRDLGADAADKGLQAHGVPVACGHGRGRGPGLPGQVRPVVAALSGT